MHRRGHVVAQSELARHVYGHDQQSSNAVNCSSATSQRKSARSSSRRGAASAISSRTFDEDVRCAVLAGAARRSPPRWCWPNSASSDCSSIIWSAPSTRRYRNLCPENRFSRNCKMGRLRVTKSAADPRFDLPLWLSGRPPPRHSVASSGRRPSGRDIRISRGMPGRRAYSLFPHRQKDDAARRPALRVPARRRRWRAGAHPPRSISSASPAPATSSAPS